MPATASCSSASVPYQHSSSPRRGPRRPAVLRTQDHIFASRAYSPATDILFYGSKGIAVSPYGEHWRHVRKIITTHLLTNKKVRSYRHAREHEVRLVVAKIHEAATTGTAVDLSELLKSFTNDIVCHAVSGKFFIEANMSLRCGFNLEDYFPMLANQGIIKRMVCAKAQKVKKMWDNLLDMIIDHHASKPASERGGEESDFIGVLLSLQQEYNLTRDHIKAHLVVIFEAGTDTSSIVLVCNGSAHVKPPPHEQATNRGDKHYSQGKRDSYGRQA